MSRPRGSMWKWALTSTLVLSSVLDSQAAAGGQEQALQARSSSSELVPAHLSNTGVSSDVLIVSLLDGHVVALDQSTGRTLWSFDSGAPLVSAKQSFASSQGLNVFPGTDGGLYAYHGITHLNPGLERLPISLPELVESAPSLTADGSIILGRRDSKVFLLDRTTGRRVHTISNAADALEDHSSSLGLTMGVPHDQLLALGRQDYVVRSVRMDSKAETWNATFSRLYLIPSGASSRSIQDFLQEGRPGAPAGPAGAGLPHLVVGTDNSLQAFDPHTLLLKWYVAFDTPPVSAYRPDGRGGNALDPEQAGRAVLGGGGTAAQDGSSSSWLVPSPSSARARPPMPSAGGGGSLGMPRRKLKGHLAGGTSVLVGALHGSLYALPADHLMLSAAAAGAAGEDGAGSAGPAGTAAVVWPKRTGRMPLDITPAVVDVCAAGPRTGAAGKQQLPGRSRAAGGSADGGGSGGGGPNSSNEGQGGSALALLDDSDAASGVVPLNPVDSGAVLDELGTLTCPQPPLGIHPITVQQGQQVGWLPLAAVQEVDQKQQHRPSPAGWLAGISRRLLWTLVALLVAVPLLLYGVWGQGHNAGTAAAAARHRPGVPLHPQLQAAGMRLALPAPGGSPAAKGAASPAGKKKSKHKHKAKQQQQEAAAAATASSSNGAAPGGLSNRDVPAHAASSSSSSGNGATADQDSSEGNQRGRASSEGSQQQQNGSVEPLSSRSGSTADKPAVQQSGSTAPGSSDPDQQQQQGGPSSLAGVDPAAGNSSSGVAVSPGLAPVQTDSIPTSPVPTAQEASAAAAALSPIAAAPAASAQSPAGGPGHMMQQHRSYVDADGAVVIGRLRVGPKELGFGSAGTIVYEGVLDSRPVAVKRLLRQFYTLARKEINVLVVSDEHPNVVRCFAMEEDREFVYLALERCKTSLAAFINDQGGAALLTDAASGAATPWCMSVLSDTAAGLAALHARQIVHRDLKPHNVLLTDSGRAKLSDMGLSKQLVSEQSSFESHGSGGSSGWQAPEQLIAKDGGSARQSRAIDVFSLGCIMFYCLSGGKHPFGEHYERDTNIIRGHCNLAPLAKWPEAVNLLGAMLSKQPLQRPAMAGVLAHPFWWSDEQRLAFLVDVSDRVENEDREPDPTLLNALESFAAPAIGTNWGAALDVELVGNLGRYRRYDYTCLRDLLRVVRNKRNHFREMPDSLQQLMGPLPNGFYRYFSSRFPMLLLGVFFFALQNLSDDPNLAKYFTPPAGEGAGPQVSDAGLEPGACFQPFKRPWDSMAAKAARASKLALAAAGGAGAESGLAAAAAAAGAAAGRGNSRRNSGSMATGPSPSKLGPAGGSASAAGGPGYQLPPAGPAAAGRSSGGGAAAAAAAGRGPPGSPPHQVPVWPPGLPRGPNLGTPPPPPPLSAVAHGSCNGGAVPPAAAAAADGVGSSMHSGGSAAGSISEGGSGRDVVVGYQVAEGQEVLHVVPFPSRPGKQLCEFYVKTGHCKFGEECVFDHPPEHGVPLTEDELPFRPGQPMCTYYYKTRHCKFGPSCKFHHPKLVPILAGSAVLKQQ